MNALKDKLKELHSTLEAAETPDAELTQLLQALDADIRSLLDKPTRDIAETAGIVTRAQASLLRFAIHHPHLEPVLRELTDMLANIGI
ncbi:MAG: DUF4404 family protein [Burkholderiales bacterium]